MNGPEHYEQAEQILAAIDWGGDIQRIIADVGEAQVHATLALAAATALATAGVPQDGDTARAWRQLTTVKREPIEVPA